MKRSLLWFGFLVLALCFVANPCFAGSHTITYFQGNKAGAVSLTFDDGYSSQVTLGVSGLTARGWKGTFFLITGNDWINGHVDWPTWQSLAIQGHEIGSHTVTHRDLTTLKGNDPKSELSDSQATINQQITSQSCTSLAYPYGNTSTSVWAHTKKLYSTARVVWSAEGGALNHYTAGQDSYGSWKAIDFYDIGSQSIDVSIIQAKLDLGYLGTTLDVAKSRHAWACFHFHEIVDTAAFGDFLYLVYTKDVWVDTFGNIAGYMSERLSSTIQVLQDTSSGITLNIKTKGSQTNVSLTLRSTVPATWTKVKVQQGSSTQTLTPVTEGSDKVIYYNALPGGGQITFTPM